MRMLITRPAAVLLLWIVITVLLLCILITLPALADPFDAPNPHEPGSRWLFSALDSSRSATLCFYDSVEIDGQVLKGRWAGAGVSGTYRVDPPGGTLRHVRANASGREVLVFFFRRNVGGEFNRDRALGHASLWDGVQAVSGTRLGWCR